MWTNWLSRPLHRAETMKALIWKKGLRDTLRYTSKPTRGHTDSQIYKHTHRNLQCWISELFLMCVCLNSYFVLVALFFVAWGGALCCNTVIILLFGNSTNSMFLVFIHLFIYEEKIMDSMGNWTLGPCSSASSSAAATMTLSHTFCFFKNHHQPKCLYKIK